MTFSVPWAIVSDSVEMYQHVTTSTASHPLFWIDALENEWDFCYYEKISQKHSIALIK